MSSAFPPSAATDPNLPHDSLEGHVLGICSAMLILVTLVVAARFWIRVKLVKGRAGPDDWCILVAWVLAAAFDLDPINQTKFGLGQHIYDLPTDTDFSKSLELYYFGEIIYYICVAVTKIAILNLYLRIGVQKNFRRLIWICGAFVVTATTACVMASIFQCTPIRRAWDVSIPGSCFDVNALFFANAGLDIFQDAVIYVLPMRMLYQLQIPKRQKVALILVFAVGGFVVITGMVRLKFLKVAQDTPDPSYNNYGGAVWSSIECNIGVVCACLPTFKAFIDRFFPTLMGRGRRELSDNTRPGIFAEAGKRGYKRETSQNEFELVEGSGGWKDPCGSAYSGERNYKSSVTADAGPPFGVNSSEEHLRDVQAQGKEDGIWKSTSVQVSSSRV